MSSSSGGDGDDSGPGTREVAHRLFAAEFDDASLEYSESDEERAPNYVVTPTGLRVNRLFAVGVLTEVESVNEDTVRGRVVDPTGAFVTYAGQYQPDELAFLDRTTPPAFVALTGKARTFQPDDSDLVYTSVRPESVSEVDADTRDRWTVSTAEATLDRLAVLAAALELDERGDALRARLEAAGAPEALAAGIPRALDHYGTTAAYVEAVRRLAVDALEVVAGEREEVRALTTDPDAAGPSDVGPLPDHGLDLDATPDVDAEESTEPGSAESASTESASTESASTESASTESASTESASTESASTTDSGSTAGATTGDSSDTDPADVAESTDAEPAAASATASTGDSSTAEQADERGTESDETGSASGSESDESAAAADSDGTTERGDDEDAAGDLGDFEDSEPGDFEDAISEEERREVEAEHDVEFSSGSEVGDPGEAGIETPEPEAGSEGESDPEPGSEATGEESTSTAEEDVPAEESSEPADAAGDAESEEAEPEEATAGTADGESAEEAPADEEPAEDVDLEDAVVDLMDELDDGDGADRDAVVSAAVDRFGADEDVADEAVQDALMSGKCYEPSEGTLKSI